MVGLRKEARKDSSKEKYWEDLKAPRERRVRKAGGSPLIK